MKIEAPFTDDQVASINAFQQSGLMHEFTCTTRHQAGSALFATREGMRCPGCDYLQTWVHTYMANGDWKYLAGVREAYDKDH